MPNLKIASEFSIIHYNELKLRLETIYEHRKSVRISLGKHHAILRQPLLLTSDQKEKNLEWARNWVIKKFEQDPVLRQRYTPKDYQTGQKIQLREREFVLEINEAADRKSALGKLEGPIIKIELPAGINARQRQQVCSTIISRILSNVFLPELTKRVHEINDRFFKKEVKQVRLKLNLSNWGSCSTKKTINLSSRLLLTPQFITDYIIVHELAHLVHMNHSAAYWKVVEKVMPEYQKAEAWLKKYGERCNF